jgi:hypothetical protein
MVSNIFYFGGKLKQCSTEGWKKKGKNTAKITMNYLYYLRRATSSSKIALFKNNKLNKNNIASISVCNITESDCNIIEVYIYIYTVCLNFSVNQ